MSYSIADEETKKREVYGLTRACKVFSLNRGTIVTYGTDESSIENDGVTIDILSAPKYLLS